MYNFQIGELLPVHAPLLSEKLKERNKWWQIKCIDASVSQNGQVESTTE
jgi:hypothetical protein